jgi:hypothetical protein
MLYVFRTLLLTLMILGLITGAAYAGKESVNSVALVFVAFFFAVGAVLMSVMLGALLADGPDDK